MSLSVVLEGGVRGLGGRGGPDRRWSRVGLVHANRQRGGDDKYENMKKTKEAIRINLS